MRIAQIAPVWFAVPPAGYGGIELVVSEIADGLAERGVDVTLFASGGSSSRGTVVSPLAEPPPPELLGNVWYDAYHTLSAYLRAHEFDLIHDHSGIIGPALGAVLDGTPPVVHTLHGPWTEQAKQYYSLIDQRVHLVAISEAQRADHLGVRYAAVVHNGIDLSAYPLREDKEDFLLFVGRSNPDKGPALAIEIAKRCGLPLKMIVKKHEPLEREYGDRVVVPQLRGDEEILESVPHEVKVDLMGRARATIFPIQWSEPFGLVMIEAMACGSPVIGSGMGAAPEVVVDGVTGFLRDTIDEMTACVGKVDELSPSECRRVVEERFSARVMVDRYEALYHQILERRSR